MSNYTVHKAVIVFEPCYFPLRVCFQGLSNNAEHKAVLGSELSRRSVCMAVSCPGSQLTRGQSATISCVHTLLTPLMIGINKLCFINCLAYDDASVGCCTFIFFVLNNLFASHSTFSFYFNIVNIALKVPLPQM